MGSQADRPGRIAALALGLVAIGGTAGTARAQDRPPATARLRVEVRLAPEHARAGPRNGRLLVALARSARPEPRDRIGQAGPGAIPSLGWDVQGLSADPPVRLEAGQAVMAPLPRAGALPAGTYHAQAVLRTNRDSTRIDAPGNLYSDVQTIRIDPAAGATLALSLSHETPPERLPADSAQVRHVKLRSERLSAFHGRPIDVRAGVILPRGFDDEHGRRYPLRVEIGGFASRYTDVDRMMAPGSPFRTSWNADDAPRMILLHLDGDGPLGDPYQVNSANHGPYGDALMEELIPYVERTFRGIGTGTSRVVTGGSTGGWVSLALQVFYPDAFQGCWSFCPDPVDFRSYQVVNIYEDENAYKAADGTERPSARDPATGRVRYTIREECAIENVLGTAGRYTRSGGQWGAWNATFSPRGPDGEPLPLWDPVTGRIDRTVAERWKTYDLRLHLESRWAELAPKLRGKLHIWVGDADDYELDAAVRRLEGFLDQARPAYGGSIAYGPGQGHCWIGIPEREMLRRMGAATGAQP